MVSRCHAQGVKAPNEALHKTVSVSTHKVTKLKLMDMERLQRTVGNHLLSHLADIVSFNAVSGRDGTGIAQVLRHVDWSDPKPELAIAKRPFAAPRSLQRMCICGQSALLGGECVECRNKRLSFQRTIPSYSLGDQSISHPEGVPVGISRLAAPVVVQRRCKPAAFYRTSSKYCRDNEYSPITHSGKICYREIPWRNSRFHCPPGEHVCFDKYGNCTESPDRASAAKGKEKDGTCDWNWYCLTQHTMKDYMPPKLRKVRKILENLLPGSQPKGDFPRPDMSETAERLT